MGAQTLTAVMGGLLVGGAAGTLLLLNGRIAGISGMLASVFEPRNGETSWRAVFLMGLVAGGGLLALFQPEALPQAPAAPAPLMAAAGLLAGLGARIGGGCTSGHGLCGVGRLSPRSITTAALFAIAGAVAVLVMKTYVGGV